jgi:hypothetical protein
VAQCRVETKIFVFVFFANILQTFFSRFSRKKLAKFFVFANVFAKIFYLECGSGFRSHLNVYLDPKNWLTIFAKTESFCENHPGNKHFSRKVSEFSLIFAFRENEKMGFRFNTSPMASHNKSFDTTHSPLLAVVRQVLETYFCR